MNWFYDVVNGVCLYVCMMVFVGLIMIMLGQTFGSYYNMMWVELLWTFFPSMVLLFLMVPSFKVLMDVNTEGIMEELMLNIIGHQWYWSYNMNGNMSDFDSFMMNSMDLMMGDFRLLNTDNSMVLPLNLWTKISCTSSDVLHSWSLPSSSIKLDCTPMHFNTNSMMMTMSGKFYGMCSEICGVNHSFMPINVEVVPFSMYLVWYLFMLTW